MDSRGTSSLQPRLASPQLPSVRMAPGSRANEESLGRTIRMSLRAQRSNLPCRELRLLRRCAPPKKRKGRVPRSNSFARVFQRRAAVEAGTLKLRWGVAPQARGWVSSRHQPRRGPATRNDIHAVCQPALHLPRAGGGFRLDRQVTVCYPAQAVHVLGPFICVLGAAAGPIRGATPNTNCQSER